MDLIREIGYFSLSIYSISRPLRSKRTRGWKGAAVWRSFVETLLRDTVTRRRAARLGLACARQNKTVHGEDLTKTFEAHFFRLRVCSRTQSDLRRTDKKKTLRGVARDLGCMTEIAFNHFFFYIYIQKKKVYRDVNVGWWRCDFYSTIFVEKRIGTCRCCHDFSWTHPISLTCRLGLFLSASGFQFYNIL